MMGDPDFLYAALETTACAAFSEESRMKFVNATKLDRKSGGSPSRAFMFNLRRSTGRRRWIRLQAVGLAEFSYHLPGITMLPVDGLVHGLHFLCCDFARQAGKGGS